MGVIGKYLKPYTKQVALGVTIKFAGAMFDLVIPFLLGYIVDTAMPQGSKVVLKSGIWMLLCSIGAWVCNVIANKIAVTNTCKMTRDLRLSLFKHITAIPSYERSRISTSSLVSRLTNDTYNVYTFVDKIQRVGIRAPLLIIGGLIFTAAIEPWLALIQLIIVPLMGLTAWLVLRHSFPLFINVQQRVDSLVRTLRENAAGTRVIRALSRTEYEKERFEKVNFGVRNAEVKAGKVMSLTNSVMPLFLNTGLIMVLLIGAYRINAGDSKPGVIIAFLSYFTIILSAVMSIMKIFISWSKGNASAKRIKEVFDIATEGSIEPGVNASEPINTENGVNSSTDEILRFEGITFSYMHINPQPFSGNVSEKVSENVDSNKNELINAVENISFSLNKGETLGILGPTGSGKSTLLQLALRFLIPDKGHIYLNGTDIAGMNVAKLRSYFGVVFQNDALLSGTVKDNISFFRNLPFSDIVSAAKDAQIADFIETLPEKYEARLDIRGANFSGGQKQRILIARALAAKPQILLFDDAESALDYETDRKLRLALKENYPDLTLIVIASRISALAHANKILIIREGKILDSGTHGELVKRCEYYKRLVEIQMGSEVNAS
ncbi:MAG: ABC transporter ATP-binding protein/permease [Lachnospiraceae bacterium]|nr:ABC transporter ATP-binding protein/permease [Lachnospiraceae bacterium]